MPIGAQLKAFAPVVFAAAVVLDAADVAQRELAVLVIAFELRLDFVGRVVEQDVV